MRVAHILRKYDPTEWGGVETAVLQLIKGLRNQGVDSVVYAPALARSHDGDDPFAQASFIVRRYASTLPVVGISDNERSRRVAVGGNILSINLLVQLIEADVDVFHTHTLNRIGGSVRFVSKLQTKPYVVSIHGGYLDIPPQVASDLRARGARGFDWGKPFGVLVGSRRVVQDASAVFTVNPKETELLKAKYPSLVVETMPQGVDPVPFSRPCADRASKRFQISPANKVLLSVGRIHSVKNQVFLVDALQSLRERVPNALLVIVGGVTDESYAAQLRQRVAQTGLQAHVRILAPLSPGDDGLVGLYQRADLFVMPSTAEPLGLVFIEAVMAQTPFLGSNTAGAKHVVAVSEGGEVFEIGDEAAFVDAAERLLRAPPSAQERARARARVIERFSPDAVARRHLTHYERVLRKIVR